LRDGMGFFVGYRVVVAVDGGVDAFCHNLLVHRV
jgi:hypothetical protein